MGRGQGDYYQATRGGGHGDYRTPVLAPSTVAEAVELVPVAFDLADRWRNPVLIYGDYYLGHTSQAIDVPAPAAVRRRDKPWALDGSTGGSGHAKLLSSLGVAKQRDGVGYDLAEHLERAGVATLEMAAGVEPRCDVGHCDDAELVVVAFGTIGRFVRWVVKELRSEGHRVGYVRPITLFPFPSEARGRGGGGRSFGRRLREQPRPDDRRRAAERARIVPGRRSSAASRWTRRASGSGPRSMRRGSAPASSTNSRRMDGRHVMETESVGSAGGTAHRPASPTMRRWSTTSLRTSSTSAPTISAPAAASRSPSVPRSSASTNSARSSAPSRCSASAATRRSPTISTSSCSRRSTVARRRWPPA